MRRIIAAALVILSACGGGATPAVAPPSTAASAAASSSSSAVDLTAAKAEGTVSWYTSTPQDTAQKISDMFTAQTGIKVQLFRSGGEAVMTRFLTEQDAGRVATDVLTTSDTAPFNGLARDGKLLKFTPKGADVVPQSAKSTDGTWISQRLNLVVPAFRSASFSPMHAITCRPASSPTATTTPPS